MKDAELTKLAQKYLALRTKRLALDKQAEELKTEETMIRQMVKTEMLGRLTKGPLFKDSKAKVEAELKMYASGEVTDWDKLQKHIQETGEFDLLQKRLTVTAARQRWEVGKEVPGVKQTQEFEVTIKAVRD